MLKLIARPTNTNEPDLLDGNERKPLIVRDLAGTDRIEIPTATGWTHDALEQASTSPAVKAFIANHGGADAYLGDVWIGSTEV
jgi:hypothetical protein